MAAVVSVRARADRRGADGGVPPRTHVGDIQRSRLLAGAVAAVRELGYEGATVGRITARSRVSRRTFYELFTNRDECLAAVVQDAVRRMQCELHAAGVDDRLPWRERVRLGLEGILGFLDREPALARVCVVDALRAGASVQACRERVLAQLAAVVDEGRVQGARGDGCSTLTAEGLVGAEFAIVHARLAHPGPGSRGGSGSGQESPALLGLAGELTAMIMLPYLGPGAARRERERPARTEAVPAQPSRPSSAPVGAEDPLHGVRMRITYRTARVLEGVGSLSRDGAPPSNRQIAVFAGVSDPGQISKLLRRLERLGLLENRGGGHVHGEPNAWRLTGKGSLIAEGLRAHATTAREAV